LRSVTETSIIFMITMPPTTKEMAAMPMVAIKKVWLKPVQIPSRLALVSMSKLSSPPSSRGAWHEGRRRASSTASLRALPRCRPFPQSAGCYCALHIVQARGHGNHHVIVSALPRVVPSSFPRQLPGKSAIDTDFLAQWIRTRHQMIHDIRSHHGDRGPIIQVGLVQHAARLRSISRIVAIPGVTPRTMVSLIDCSLYFTWPVRCVWRLQPTRSGDRHPPPPGSPPCQIFCASQLPEVVHVGNGGRNFEDKKNIRAQIEYLLRHVIVDAGDKCGLRRSRQPLRSPREQREHGTQLFPHSDCSAIRMASACSWRGFGLRLRTTFCRSPLVDKSISTRLTRPILYPKPDS